MAKILWQPETGTLASQQHIIDKLKENEHDVFVENRGDYTRFQNKNHLAIHNDKHYDFAIYTIHTGNPMATNFVMNLNCQKKFIIVHDIFGDQVEGGTPSWENVELIVFTKKHELYAKQHGVKNIVQARWYKLDM